MRKSYICPQCGGTLHLKPFDDCHTEYDCDLCGKKILYERNDAYSPWIVIRSDFDMVDPISYQQSLKKEIKSLMDLFSSTRAIEQFMGREISEELACAIQSAVLDLGRISDRFDEG